MTIVEHVFGFKTKHKEGFIQSEIDEILKSYPDIDMGRFLNALTGITCMGDEHGNSIIYHVDIATAITLGVEKRDMHQHEWD